MFDILITEIPIHSHILYQNTHIYWFVFFAACDVTSDRRWKTPAVDWTIHTSPPRKLWHTHRCVYLNRSGVILSNTGNDFSVDNINRKLFPFQVISFCFTVWQRFIQNLLSFLYNNLQPTSEGSEFVFILLWRAGESDWWECYHQVLSHHVFGGWLYECSELFHSLCSHSSSPSSTKKHRTSCRWNRRPQTKLFFYKEEENRGNKIL